MSKGKQQPLHKLFDESEWGKHRLYLVHVTNDEAVGPDCFVELIRTDSEETLEREMEEVRHAIAVKNIDRTIFSHRTERQKLQDADTLIHERIDDLTPLSDKKDVGS